MKFLVLDSNIFRPMGFQSVNQAVSQAGRQAASQPGNQAISQSVSLSLTLFYIHVIIFKLLLVIVMFSYVCHIIM